MTPLQRDDLVTWYSNGRTHSFHIHGGGWRLGKVISNTKGTVRVRRLHALDVTESLPEAKVYRYPTTKDPWGGKKLTTGQPSVVWK